MAAGATLGTVWMVALTLPPYLLSRAIDDGLRVGHSGALLGWVAALAAVGVLNAGLAILRHRTMTRVRMDGAFRTVRAVVRHATRLGAVLPRTVSAGEVATIGIADVWVISMTLTVTGPGVGAVLAYLVVAGLLLDISALLATVVLVGVPLLAVLVGPLLGRLQRAGATYRAGQGALAARIVDLVGGLRVLNGLGGKDLHAARFRTDSRRLETEGYRVGAVTSWIDALGVGLPALFLAVVTWLAARLAARGDISIGELVAVYGYVAVLVVPVAMFIEGGLDIVKGRVAARRVIDFLRLEPAADAGTAEPPGSPAELADPASGVRVVPGRLTVLASARPAESAAVIDRLGRFADSAATWGGVRLDAIGLGRIRDRILVADNEADLFAGTLREVVSGRWEPDDAAIARALHAASARDVVHATDGGLDAAVEPHGHNLSGGQRQRVRLVRALLADPEVLLATEPTSAVDAHTEAAVAERLHAARAGRCTVLTSTSPLVLDRADSVYYLVDGVVAAHGTHRELLDTEPGYRDLVARGADEVVR
ncbi:ABC transporter ATP-binding protein [Longispora sp. NPDC051575]|uniref:ABC transporter ATP-binding protein n=1 Tax=Longispora sp. NPDC051575 TaxID=3154943 RepID=UPI003422CA55